MRSAAPDADTVVSRGVATSRSAASPKSANASSRLSVPFFSSRCIKLSTTAALAKPSSVALLPWNMIYLTIRCTVMGWFVHKLPELTPEQYAVLVKNAPKHGEIMQDMEMSGGDHKHNGEHEHE